MKNLFTLKTIGLKTGSCFAIMAAALFSVNQAQAGSGVVAKKSKAESLKESFLMANNQVLVGGDISLDFVAAAPYTYNHATGGGAYDDRTIGKSADVVESLEGGDFKCGDHVSYLTKITVAPGASASNTNRTIQLDYSFLAAATGQPGVALGAFGDVKVNYGVIGMNAGDGAGGKDGGMIDDGGSNATLSNNLVNGTLFIKPATLTGKVTIDDLEPGEVVILRVDVIIECQFPSSPTGNLQASLPAGRIVGVSGKNGTISVGQQTVPFKNVNLIQPGTCTLIPDYTAVCEGDIQAYTLTTNGTPTWSLTGDGIFTDASGTPLLNNDPGTALQVYVKSTQPSGLVGGYTLDVHINSIVTPTSCSDAVIVNANAAQPYVVIHDGISSLCDASASVLPSVEVCSPIDGLTYVIEYGAKDINNNYTKTASIKNTVADNPAYPAVVFTGLDAGFGFRVRATNNGNCPSAWTDCNSSAYILSTCDMTKVAKPGIAPPSSLNKVENKDLSAYPVPFSENVTVEFKASKAENYTINLYDLQGHLVRELKAGNAKAGEIIKFQVSGSGMAESMYLVRKVSKSGISTVKLLKKE